jgi:hypothetical protein
LSNINSQRNNNIKYIIFAFLYIRWATTYFFLPYKDLLIRFRNAQNKILEASILTMPISVWTEKWLLSLLISGIYYREQ